MVDASRGDAEAFLAADDPRTLVETVRVAAYPADLPVAFELLRALGFKGYEVCLNVMAVHALEAEHLEALRRFAVAGVADWLCLGDSFGALRPSAIRPLVERFTALGFERLGFHPHNNMQLAFANTLEAVAAGVTMVDATAFGMGRGAGNLPMELWLGHLEDQGCPGIQAAPYLDLVARRFEPLQAELGWGYSVARVLSGLAGVHPAYVAELLAEPGAAPGAVWAALPALRAQWPMAFEVVAAEATRGGPCAR
jgi:4-hydroxy 2-oxovalerate aldolase